MTHTGQIREIPHSKGGNVWTVAPDTTVFEALQMMAEKNVGALLVTKDSQLVGIISERDMLKKVVAPGLDPRDVYAAQIMSKNVATVTPEDTWEGALRIMREKHCRHLPVLKNGKLVGMIPVCSALSIAANPV